MTYRQCLPLALLFLASGPAAAQVDLPHLIDTLATQELGASGSPGLIVGASFEDHTVVAKGYGRTDNASGGSPTLDTVFSIGPLSSSLTSFGLMLLIDQKKISLETPASKYVDKLPKAWQGITIRQFLDQSSGIPNFRKALTGTEVQEDTWLNALDRTELEPMQFTPGTQQKFEIGNYAVVGRLIEKLSGKPYLQYMKDAVFTPLGMTHTGIGLTANLASGYQIEKGSLRPAKQTLPNYLVPAAGLQSSVGDLLKWEEAMYSSKLLSVPLYKEMFHPNVPPAPAHGHNALGWQTRILGHDLLADQGGSISGFDSRMVIDLTRGVAVVAVRNSSGGKSDLDRMCVAILQQGMGAGTVPPVFPARKGRQSRRPRWLF